MLVWTAIISTVTGTIGAYLAKPAAEAAWYLLEPYWEEVAKKLSPNKEFPIENNDEDGNNL